MVLTAVSLHASCCCLQGDEAAADPAELEQLAAQDAEVRQQLSEVRAANKRLDDQIRSLQSEMSDEQLATEIKQYGKQVDTLNARLARIKGDGKQVDKASMQRVQKAFNDACAAWAKRKKVSDDIMGDMAGEDGSIKEVIVSAHTCACHTARGLQSTGLVAHTSASLSAVAICRRSWAWRRTRKRRSNWPTGSRSSKKSRSKVQQCHAQHSGDHIHSRARVPQPFFQRCSLSAFANCPSSCPLPPIARSLLHHSHHVHACIVFRKVMITVSSLSERTRNIKPAAEQQPDRRRRAREEHARGAA